MIVGIGTDIVHIPRIAAGLARHSRRFAARILADGELTEFDKATRPEAYLAKRFAVKEAVAKAFGTGFRDGLSLKHICVANDSLGRPHVALFAKAQELAQQRQVAAVHVSLADEQEYAIAYVVMESR
ncbi:MAG: holo-ACP synthase [Gammaproteobacteria bacterium]|nr:holo-ACP synthase [Gammaproteobacteria bacterium]